MMEEKQNQQDMEEEIMQQLRFKATELLLREEWNESIQVYSHFISLSLDSLSKINEKSDPDQFSKLQKSLCLAFSNRAESRLRLRNFSEALEDCDRALKIETTHFKTLLCKGKILLNLNQYSNASNCFKQALSDTQNNGNSEMLNGYLDRCKKLEFQSRTGTFDLSDWVLNGFRGKSPELAEYIGSIEIKKSENGGGRGLFSTKNIEAGTLLFVTNAIATGRGILPESDEESKMIMWKDFVDKVLDSASKCRKTHDLICMLSTGEDEEKLEVPEINLFRPETEEGTSFLSKEKEPETEMSKILNILDVNSLTEDAISAKVLGKNSDYYGVGLWVLASFINHSCDPNSRRLHVGDHLIVHASRDIKAGEEITFAYFDVLTTLKKRREMSQNWGFKCNCKRCRFEEEMIDHKEGFKEIEMFIECGSEYGNVVVRLEEGMKRWMVKGKKEKGYLRASFWAIFSEVFRSEKSVRKWGRRIPPVETVAETVADAVGGDERVLQMVVEELKRNSSGGGLVEMEKAMKMGRCVYGKVVKKKAMKALLELISIS